MGYPTSSERTISEGSINPSEQIGVSLAVVHCGRMERQHSGERRRSVG
jgi:hypothetical protein